MNFFLIVLIIDFALKSFTNALKFSLIEILHKILAYIVLNVRI
jgi:hypothetical protein